MKDDTLVLCHHAVSDDWPADLAVRPDRFEWQLRNLLARGYSATTFSAAVTNTRAGRVLAVTFDDAFLSVLTTAEPIMRKLGIVGTVFVPTSHIGAGGMLTWPGIDQWLGTSHEEELTGLTWDQLRALSREGWEIGSHSCTHPRLPSLRTATLASELVDSRRKCETELGQTCRSLAYPYGDVDDRVIAEARSAGYDAAAALPIGRHVVEPFSWPRVGVYRRDDSKRFMLKTSPAFRRVQRSPAWSVVSFARSASKRSPKDSDDSIST